MTLLANIKNKLGHQMLLLLAWNYNIKYAIMTYIISSKCLLLDKEPHPEKYTVKQADRVAGASIDT
jgi:hypothetical protein